MSKDDDKKYNDMCFLALNHIPTFFIVDYCVYVTAGRSNAGLNYRRAEFCDGEVIHEFLSWDDVRDLVTGGAIIVEGVKDPIDW